MEQLVLAMLGAARLELARRSLSLDDALSRRKLLGWWRVPERERACVRRLQAELLEWWWELAAVHPKRPVKHRAEPVHVRLVRLVAVCCVWKQRLQRTRLPVESRAEALKD